MIKRDSELEEILEKNIENKNFREKLKEIIEKYQEELGKNKENFYENVLKLLSSDLPQSYYGSIYVLPYLFNKKTLKKIKEEIKNYLNDLNAS